MSASGGTPMLSWMLRDTLVKRKFSSCSQYQSEDSSVRLRKRSSLSRRANSAFLRSVSSSNTAISYRDFPSASRTSATVRSAQTVAPSLRR